MTATYTFDVFSSLDGYGSYGPPGTGAATGASRARSLLAHRLSTQLDTLAGPAASSGSGRS